jgi:hypothetical protein
MIAQPVDHRERAHAGAPGKSPEVSLLANEVAGNLLRLRMTAFNPIGVETRSGSVNETHVLQSDRKTSLNEIDDRSFQLLILTRIKGCVDQSDWGLPTYSALAVALCRKTIPQRRGLKNALTIGFLPISL